MSELQATGCLKAAINTTELGFADSEISSSTLEATASVIEEGTGVTLNATTVNTQISSTPLNLNMYQYSPETFKPGLDYHGKVSMLHSLTRIAESESQL